MPEGPEVSHSADILHSRLAGYSIISVKYTADFNDSREWLDQDMLAQDLPLLVHKVIPRAKRINFICTNSKDEGSALIWFYAMTGRLCFKHRGKPLIIMTMELRKRGEVVDTFDLYYEDSRKLGIVRFCTTEAQIENVYKDIGPDFLLGQVSLEIFKDIIQNPKIANKAIGEVLLEQKRCAGIGNYLRAEILYASGISPFRSAGSLTLSELKLLYTNSMDILSRSKAKGGMTSNNYLDPNGDIGTFEVCVYNKAADPEGYDVIGDKMGSVPAGKDNRRTIWWCPDKQH
jgi:endonuclease-8